MIDIHKLSDLVYDEIIEVQQFKINQSNDRPAVENKIRKFVFFVMAEGISRTFAKINSKRDKQFVFNKYHTTIRLKFKDKIYINYSTQTSENIDDFIVKNIFIEWDDVPKASNTPDNLFNQFLPYYDDSLNTNKTIQLAIKELPPLVSEETIFAKGVFIYGLGDYSRVYIAPNIKKLEKIFCVDYIANISSFYKKKYGYIYNGIVPQDSYHVLRKVSKPMAIIATYHSDHTRIAEEIYHQNPKSLIFIEKPPCVTLIDITNLANLYRKGANIEIGYNRRFIKINQIIKKRLNGQRAIINISVKEILISENHWYFWQNQGTRITGNLTHWIDLCNYWLEDEIPAEITMLKSNTKDETFTTSILYSNGSLVNLTVSDKGNALRGVQEKIEIRTKDESYFIDDYLRTYIIHNNGRKENFNKILRSKGHDEMYRHVMELYHNKTEFRYSINDLIKTALTTFYVSEMFKNTTNHFDCKDAIIKMLNEYN